MSIEPHDFQFVCNLASRGPGIILDPDCQYVVEARLSQLAFQEGFRSVGHLIHQVRDNGHATLHRKLLDAITNNETWFFRDFPQFEALRDTVLPDLIRARENVRRIVIWSAACSTGQEPYSIAMMIREHFPQLSTWNIELIATDFSTSALERAQAGVYSQFEINRGMPLHLLNRYFDRDRVDWILHRDVRQMVTFRHLNLMRPVYDVPDCDIIFLRNVLIYFDRRGKQAILSKMTAALQNDGYFLLGAAESIAGEVAARFDAVQLDRSRWYRLRQ